MLLFQQAVVQLSGQERKLATATLSTFILVSELGIVSLCSLKKTLIAKTPTTEQPIPPVVVNPV